jgi:hypothetical protein
MVHDAARSLFDDSHSRITATGVDQRRLLLRARCALHLLLENLLRLNRVRAGSWGLFAVDVLFLSGALAGGHLLAGRDPTLVGLIWPAIGLKMENEWHTKRTLGAVASHKPLHPSSFLIFFSAFGTDILYSSSRTL